MMTVALKKVAFDSLDDAKTFARNRLVWREIMRFDWHWSRERGEPVIELW
jgi:hypothetical protein